MHHQVKAGLRWLSKLSNPLVTGQQTDEHYFGKSGCAPLLRLDLNPVVIRSNDAFHFDRGQRSDRSASDPRARRNLWLNRGQQLGRGIGSMS